MNREEHEKEDRFRYARFLKKPLKEKQILFWNGNQCEFAGEPKERYLQLKEAYGDEYTYVWVYKNEKPAQAETSIVWVKKNSIQYWEALAVSATLIGCGNLPVSFCKRQGQTYLGAPSKPETEGIDAESLYVKELLKTDEYLGECERESLLKACGFENHTEDKRERVLFLVNWKEEREHRYVIREVLKRADLKKYDITVASPKMMSAVLEKEFKALPEGVKKFIYRGRMTVTEVEYLFYRDLEKHPGLYIKDAQLREQADVLGVAEWQRIWGNQMFDHVVLAGTLTAQQYLMACALKCKKMTLIDMEFLKTFKNKNESEWKQMCSVFDEIYTLPLWREAGIKKQDTIELEGKKYLICDTWEGEHHRVVRKLIALSDTGEIVKNEFTEKYLPMYM